MNELSAKQLQKYKKFDIPELISIASRHFNKYIRKRDSEDGYFKCISCGECKPVEQMNAGHYLSAGHNGILRFSEDNVHGQCIYCNYHLHGNSGKYRVGLVEKIGVDKVEILESTARMSHKWTREGLIMVIETYKNKAK